MRTLVQVSRKASASIKKNLSSSATSGKAKVPPRRKVSPEERAAIRAARKQQSAQALEQTQASGGTANASSSTVGTASTTTTAASRPSTSKPMDPRVFYSLVLGVPTAVLAWGIADEDSPPAKFAEMIGLTGQIESVAIGFKKPANEKLLPDWGMMPNVPQNMEPPHTLVLDLENTLVNSTWDRKHGWRFAKRPGVDKFLSEMAQYYEIVLYSPSVDGVADPVVTLLDPKGCIMHRLYRESCYYQNGVYMKDLSSLNRNTNKIVLLDDDDKAGALNPDNLIRVKPYDDPKDRDDKTLERITPFLIEIAREGHNNIPLLMRQFKNQDGTAMDADQIADEHERRVQEMRSLKMRSAQRGLGTFSAMGNRDMPAPEMTPVSSRQKAARGVAAPTAKDLVGAAPADANKKGAKGLTGWLQKRQIEQQEEQMRKNEYWTKVMQAKDEERRRKAEQAA